MVTTQGVFITNNVTATPIVWTQLGAATSPAGACGIKLGYGGRTADVFRAGRRVRRASCGSALEVCRDQPGGCVGSHRQQSARRWCRRLCGRSQATRTRLYASNLTPTGPRMMFSTDSGTTWTNDAGLDSAMTGGGCVRLPEPARSHRLYRIWRLSSADTWSPSTRRIPISSSRAAPIPGVFVSTDGGGSWSVITDPITSGTSGKPHLPRPWFVHFDHEPPNRVKVYIGTQGRGVWRAEFEVAGTAFRVCGEARVRIQDEPANLRLARGLYATTINVHNPNQQTAVFKKKLALTFPAGRAASRQDSADQPGHLARR